MTGSDTVLGQLRIMRGAALAPDTGRPVSYTHLRAHETVLDLVCRLLLEKKKKTSPQSHVRYKHSKCEQLYIADRGDQRRDTA